MTVAIDETIHSGLAEDDVDLLLKYYGYLRGPIFLDVLVDYYRHPPVVPERLDDLSPGAMKELAMKLLIRTMIVARTVPIDTLTQMRLKAIQRVADVLASGDFSESAMALFCKTLGVKRASMPGTPATTSRDTVRTANGDNPVVEAMVTPASEEGPSLAQVA